MRTRAIKKIRHAGRGSPPSFVDGTKAVFDYEVRLLPADRDSDELAAVPNDQFEVIDDTRKSYPDGYGQPLELVFGKKFQLPVLEECVQTMLIDEVASFDIQPMELLAYPTVSKKLRDLAHEREHPEAHNKQKSSSCCWGLAASAGGLGYPQLDKVMSHPQPLRFTFHLHRVLQPDDYEQASWQLDADQKLASVEQLRVKGNTAFKDGDWRLAAGKYCEAISRLDSLMMMEKPGEPEHIDMDERKLPFYLNLTQCQLNMQQYYEAIESATEALQRSAHSEKGLYRRAKAYESVWDLDKAVADLQQLRAAHPQSTALVAQELGRIEKLRAEKVLTEKQSFGNIFTK